MELIMKFDLKDIKEDMSDSFWNAHSINWDDSEKPTNGELKDSIKSEIDTWLDDLGISFDMQERDIFGYSEEMRSRLNKLQSQTKENKNIDQLINSFKPPIFWKDKEIVKEQIKNWTLKKVESLIYKTNEIELLIKKNSSNSINILFDFILTESNKTNN